MWGAAPILFRCARCSGTLVWARPAAATPAGAGSAAPPPPALRSFPGRGGRPLGSGAAEGRACGSLAGGGAGGGWEGRPPAPLPRRASACRPLPRACPPGVYWCRGGCWAAAGVGRGPVGRRRVSAAGGGGGGGGGGNPPALVRAPVFPGPASDKAAPFAPSWALPVPVGRRQAGRVGACLGRGAPAARVQRPLRGGCGAAVSSVRLRPLLGLSGRGGGSGGGPSGPLATPPDGRGGGRHGGPGPGGQPSARGSRPSPAPLYLELDPRAGPCRGSSSPRPSLRGAGRPGAAVRVSGQRLAGCGAAGFPPRSLSQPSLPREVARSPASCRTVGGAWVGGPSSPPPLSRFRRLGRHLRRRLCGGWSCGGGGLRRR